MSYPSLCLSSPPVTRADPFRTSQDVTHLAPCSLVPDAPPFRPHLCPPTVRAPSGQPGGIPGKGAGGFGGRGTPPPDPIRNQHFSYYTHIHISTSYTPFISPHTFYYRIRPPHCLLFLPLPATPKTPLYLLFGRPIIHFSKPPSIRDSIRPALCNALEGPQAPFFPSESRNRPQVDPPSPQ